MPTKCLLAVIALACEAVSLLLLSAITWQYFAMHTIAAVCMAMFVWQLMQDNYRQPREWALVLLFTWCFFLPVLGITGLFVAVLVVYWSPKPQSKPSFIALSAPVYRASNQAKPHEFGAGIGSIREQLTNNQFTTEVRMKALLAIQHMPTHHTDSLLRVALADSADDLRLLAYGMLEARERELMLRVERALARHQQRQNHYSTARELAELYWEMVYQNLVQGDMRRFAMEQVSRFAQQALKLNDEDGGIWVIFGRMHLLNGAYAEAEKAFSTVMSLGFLVVRTEPYIAELAFLRKDYHTVRRLMNHNFAEGRMSQPRQVAIYWRCHDHHEQE
jgi:hypothetical protein